MRYHALSSQYLENVYPNAHTSHRFRISLRLKLLAMDTLFIFYEHRQFQADRAYAFAGKQKTEAALVKSFTSRFIPLGTTPNDVCVFFGNWSKREGMRFQGPVPSIGLRRLLRKSVCLLYLVNENYTSQTCFQCKTPAYEKPLRNRNPQPWRRATTPTVECHGLLRCTACNTYWNRDHNVALNILDIGMQWVYNRTRPVHL